MISTAALEERSAWAPPQLSDSGLGVVIVNYRTPHLTLRCLSSLGALNPLPGWVVILDQDPEEGRALELSPDIFCLFPQTAVRVFVSKVNLGFALGCNVAVDILLKEPSCRAILLLNNDAVALPSLSQVLLKALNAAPRAGMVGGRIDKLDEPGKVDTLGITLHKSLMPANRLTLDEPFLGPTGGCCLLDRSFVEDMLTSFGYLFDPRFFCYAEDTDLAVRAILKGYQPVYIDQKVALHQGQASTGKGYQPFIAYHGIRNVIWMHVKWFSWDLLWRHVGWLFIAHFLAVVRQILSGRPDVAYRIYRDAWKGLPSFFSERKSHLELIQKGSVLISEKLSDRFYQSGYFKSTLIQLCKDYLKYFKVVIKLSN